MKKTLLKITAAIMALMLLLCGTALAGNMDEAGVCDDLETLAAAAHGAVPIDVPEGATEVLYMWIEDQDIARIYFTLDGEDYNFSFRAGKLDEDDYICCDFGDYNEYVPTEGNIKLRMSEAFAAAEGYSPSNDTSYALMGPAAENGAVVMTMAEKLFPEDCK